jgi:lysozyme
MPTVDKPKVEKHRKTKVALFTTLMALATALGVNEGMRTKPYLDSVGVPTVCEGITGPDVIWGKTYTLLECRDLKMKYLQRMNIKLGSCLKVELSQEEWLAYGHASYNFGAGVFCKNFAPLINAGNNHLACAKLTKYVFARGRDCRIRSNNCYGVVTRREFERSICESGLE